LIDQKALSNRSADARWGAATQAQELVLAAQAIESRISALSADTPPAVVRETVTLLRAGAAQMSQLLLELVVLGERLASATSTEGT